MDGANLTHNHPSGSTFSAEDIALLVNSWLNSIRAVGKFVAYELKQMKSITKNKLFAHDFQSECDRLKTKSDNIYRRITEQYKTFGITYEEYTNKVDALNAEVNVHRSEWLKKNSKTYGYKYSVRRK